MANDIIFNADMTIGEPIKQKIVKGNIISRSDAMEILDTIANSVCKDVKDYQRQTGAATFLKNKMQELISLYTIEENKMIKVENNLSQYSKNAGWSDFIYQKPAQVSWEKIFKICSEILDVMRTGRLDEHLRITVYSTDKNKQLTRVYQGEERSLDLKPVKEEYEVDGILKTREFLQYTLNECKLEISKVQKESLFAKHFNNFRKAILTSESLKEKKESNQVNEGHIIEAFQRHLYFNHQILNLKEEDFNNAALWSDNPIDHQQALINLYYSINSDAWYSGGDVLNIQVKGSNRRIASLMSIKVVASKLLSIALHYENFNVNNFKKLFTQGELDKMTLEDPEDLANKTVDELVSLIATKSKIE